MQSAEEEVLRSQGYKASTSEIGASEMTAAQGPQDTQALNGRFVGSFLEQFANVLSPSLIFAVAKTSVKRFVFWFLSKNRGLTVKLSFILSRLAVPSSPFEDDSDDVDEEPLVRHRPRRAASGSLAPPNADRSRSGSPDEERASINPAEHGSGFPSEVFIKSVSLITLKPD